MKHRRMSAQALFRVALFSLLLSLATNSPAAVSNVAYWRFGENDPGAVNGAITTSTTNMLGGSMTLANSPRYTNDVAASAATIGSTLGLRFNGTSYGTNTLVSTLTNNFGLELWVKPAVSNVTQCLAYNGNSGANGWGIYILSGQYQALFGAVALVNSSVAATTNVWTHLALVRNNGTNVFYVNGTAATTNTAAPNVPTGNFAVAVQPQTLTTEFFNGAVDEVRVFSFAPGGFSTNDLLLNNGLLVTTTANSGAGSLRDVIAATAPGGTVRFATNLSGQTITLTSEIILNKNLTLTATNLPANLVISGGGTTRLFYLDNSANITMNNLTLTGGNGTGAFDNGFGGAILQFNGSLTMTRCTLVGNSASGIFGGAGGAIYNAGTLILNLCTLSGNSATEVGGAIFSSGTPTLNQCTLSGNSATNDGGAVYVQNGLTLVQSTITANNSAAGSGGGVYRFSGSFFATNSIIAGNTAASFSNVLGGFSSSVSNLVDVAPLLAPLGNYGGPTQTRPPLPGSPAINTGLNSVTNSLTTDQRGLPRLVGPRVDIGAVESGTLIPGVDYSVVTTTNDFLSELTNNGVSLRSAAAFVTNNATITFAPNLAGQTITLTTEIVISKNLNITATNLPTNMVISGGGATRLFYINNSANITMNNLTLTGGNGAGTIAGAGGAIYAVSGSLTMNRCTLSGNTASGSSGGGAIRADGTLALNQCTLSGNSATAGTGGAVRVSSTAALTQCTLTGNSAILNGGAIDAGSSSITLTHCTITANTAVAGGGIYRFSGGTTTATNSIIAGNIVTGGSATNISDASFTGVNNLTNGNPLLAPLGNYGGPTQTCPPLPGSLAINAGNNSVTNSLTTDQRGLPRLVGAAVDIGAVESGNPQANPIPGYDYSVVTTTNDNLTGDPTTGVSLRSAVAYVPANSTITFATNLSGQTITLTSEINLNKNLTITATNLPNNLVISGGGTTRLFYIFNNANITMNNLTLTGGNGAGANGGAGGAIYLPIGSSLNMTRCTLSDNTAGSGGAIYFNDGLYLNQCTLVRNSAVTYGGAIHAAFLDLNLLQCTITGNSAAYGGGIAHTFAGTTLSTNSIVAGNTAPSGPNIQGSISGLNNFTGTNPLLAPLGNYGGPTQTCPPLTGSPAIDAGLDSVTNSLTTDQRGKPRLLGSQVDIGAVEGVFDANYPLVNVTQLGSGNVQFAFTNLSGPTYTVLASTNVALPIASWQNLGAPLESPAGVFTFTDLQATNYPQRFYRVTTP